jgi:hypothetical protein
MVSEKITVAFLNQLLITNKFTGMVNGSPKNNSLYGLDPSFNMAAT